jgi:hypothetical protein
MRKFAISIIALFVSVSAHAAFTVYVPLESQSITFNKPVQQPEPEPVQEKSPAEKCEEKIQPTINFLANNYSDVKYVSHEFSNNNCLVTASFPKSKGMDCSGSNDYAQSVSDIIFQRGFNAVFIEYYGSCS